jgi:hypothetical protein
MAPSIVPFNLSHFGCTRHVPGGVLTVVDCQGVYCAATRIFKLTDPAIHSTALTRFGSTNMGEMGLTRFGKTHVCSRFGNNHIYSNIRVPSRILYFQVDVLICNFVEFASKTVFKYSANLRMSNIVQLVLFTQ